MRQIKKPEIKGGPLSEHEREALCRLMQKEGTAAVAKRSGASVAALLRAGAGLPVLAGTRALVRLILPTLVGVVLFACGGAVDEPAPSEREPMRTHSAHVADPCTPSAAAMAECLEARVIEPPLDESTIALTPECSRELSGKCGELADGVRCCVLATGASWP